MMRLQKFLAANTGISRRYAEDCIKHGEVTVNGETIATLGVKINPETDDISWNGKKISSDPKKIYIVFYKPAGILCSKYDPHYTETIMKYFPKELHHLYPIGRLDKDSEGLLLLTNDGDMTYNLTHPKHDFKKIYIVKTSGVWSRNDIARLASEIKIHNTNYRPIEAQQFLTNTEENVSFLTFTLTEGKKREIRIICEAFRHPVISLKRIQIGPITLGNLKKGEYRYFSDWEKNCLL